jgi:DivIVA domain-containing protein
LIVSRGSGRPPDRRQLPQRGTIVTDKAAAEGIKVTVFWVVLGIAVLAVVAIVAAGRGGGMSPAEPDRPDVVLPDDRLVNRTDVDRVRFSVGLRGYRMDEVDDVLDRIAADVESRDARIRELEAELRAGLATQPPTQPPTQPATQPTTQPATQQSQEAAPADPPGTPHSSDVFGLAPPEPTDQADAATARVLVVPIETPRDQMPDEPESPVDGDHAADRADPSTPRGPDAPDSHFRSSGDAGD